MAPSRTASNKIRAADIERLGIIMSSSCYRCEQSKKPCIMSECNKRCSECVRQGKSCIRDSNFVPRSDWNKLYRARDKIEADKRRVEEEQAQRDADIARLGNELTRLFAARQESINRNRRLRDQEKFLNDRAGKFLESDAQTLEELEKLEEEENKRKQAEATATDKLQALLATISNVPSPSGFNFTAFDSAAMLPEHSPNS
ncbi:hypothetical protein AJ80_10087 [Polytolypa hystricis UAMH7299]|uniref:Zn(2)-C6 fungal-type domain-containing protein n=1 Tax=Polytolypa hystricis (strain UAMH7299) TaxID=1447883 RepID=A0A2B7WEM7_POLH7|nr:hypothetical protein AJ80_10087 [Polytolypa hystricis UAMH7299]